MWEDFKINLVIDEKIQYVINGILVFMICVVFPIIKWINKYLFSEYGEYSISSIFWKNDYIVRWWRDANNKHTISFNVVRVNSRNEANKIVCFGTNEQSWNVF